MMRKKTNLNSKKLKFTLIGAGVIFLILLALGAGTFAALYVRAGDSEQLRLTLEFIEAGKAFSDESAAFKVAAEAEANKLSSPVAPGLYTASIDRDGIIYDIALRLDVDSSYVYRLSVGNKRVSKSFSANGFWVVKGQVLHLTYGGGDAFLFSPSVRTTGSLYRAIIEQYDPETKNMLLVDSVGAQTLMRYAKPDTK